MVKFLVFALAATCVAAASYAGSPYSVGLFGSTLTPIGDSEFSGGVGVGGKAELVGAYGGMDVRLTRFAAGRGAIAFITALEFGGVAKLPLAHGAPFLGLGLGVYDGTPGGHGKPDLETAQRLSNGAAFGFYTAAGWSHRLGDRVSLLLEAKYTSCSEQTHYRTVEGKPDAGPYRESPTGRAHYGVPDRRQGFDLDGIGIGIGVSWSFGR
jgi:hypothetical protein